MRAVSIARCALGALAIAVFSLGSAPSASAKSCSGFNLSENNLGLSGSVGCVNSIQLWSQSGYGHHHHEYRLLGQAERR